MQVVVISQPRVLSNTTTEKTMMVILQLKVMGNNALEKGLVDLLIKNQLDNLAKTLMNS